MDVILNKKEVVFFTSNLGGGGAEGVCVKIANALANKGWSVTVLVQNMSNDVLSSTLEQRIRLESLDVPNIRKGLISLRLWITQNRPSQVVVFHHMLSLALILVRTTLARKFRIVSRNINTISKLKEYDSQSFYKKLQGTLVEYLYIQSDVIIHQCQGMKHDFVNKLPKTKDKCVVIYNPSLTFDTESILTSDNTSPYILFVGRLEHQKALHLAIEAFSKVLPSHPELRFRILGEGSLKQELESLANKLGVSENIDFVGFCKDTGGHFSGARLTLLSSLYEGFPNVLVESISYGTPVVSFDCKSGPNEIVIDGVNGYLANYLDVEDLAGKLTLALSNTFDRQDIINTSERFSLLSIVEHWEKVLADSKSE